VPPDLVVAGAGMAGLAAAAEARRLGARVRVYEKGDVCGGCMRWSSGVVWRHRDFAAFRAECPGGDPALQRLVWERLDGDLDWLESLGARVRARETGNPATVGRRFDPPALVEALTAAVGAEHIALDAPLTEALAGPVVLATGGFAASPALVGAHLGVDAGLLMLRATPWSTGDGLRIGLAAGGALSGGMDEFYGRAMPAPPARVAPDAWVGMAQLYARFATVRDARGDATVARTWSEIDVVQWIARRPDGMATYTVAPEDLDRRIREVAVREMIERARRAGGPVRELAGGTREVDVVAGITTTLGGLRVDAAAGGRVAGGVFAAGADAGGFATGGYASGLACALVLGRAAARAALGEAP
jgi:succinate dehydrogenase/fumarate reductase flavoprotein subunit